MEEFIESVSNKEKKPIYRSMVIQNFNEFVSELIDTQKSTPYREELSWERFIPKKLIGVGRSWSYEPVPSFGMHYEKSPNIEVLLYGYIDDIDKIDLVKTLYLNETNKKEREIRINEKEKVFVDKVCINDIHNKEYLSEDIEIGFCKKIEKEIYV